MNPDISDILASLDRQVTSSYPTSISLSDSSQVFLDHQQLTRFWVSERSAPEVLPWPTELMQRIVDRVRSQIEKIEDLAAQFSDPSSNTKDSGAPSNLNLTLAILQSDLSRTQFLIRSLLRCRLSKLSKHALHYLQQHDAIVEESQSSASSHHPRAIKSKHIILSQSEYTFLSNSQSLLHSYYSSSFLSALPPALQRLDDNAGGINMVEGPDLQTAVFVRCLAERWRSSDHTSTNQENWLNGTASMDRMNDDFDDDEDDEETGVREFDMKQGQVWVVRWADVKKGVLAGKLELL